MSIYDYVVTDRPVAHHGTLATWQCHFPGCSDGSNVDSWSCTGYPDGRCHCFSCNRNASVIDLYVQFRFGIFVAPGTKTTDANVRGAYRAAFVDLQATGYVASSTPVSRAQSGRDFNDTEQRFMYEVARLMHDDLTRDKEALAYMHGRGVEPYAIMGVARAYQMPAIRDIARQLGDSGLPARCGLVSRKYPQYMNWLLADATVVFQMQNGRVTYYQGRSLHTDRQKPYYCPYGITKKPISFEVNPGGPWFSSEGAYKVLWAAREGWNVLAPLGTQSQYIPTEKLRVLDGNGLHIGDRDANGAGLKGVQIMKERTQLSGYRVAMALTPKGYTDPDLWAGAIGYSRASAEMHRLLQRHYGR
jgi:hypothetical protein